MQTKAAADAVRAHIAETLDVLEEIRRIYEGPGPIRVAREDVRPLREPVVRVGSDRRRLERRIRA